MKTQKKSHLARLHWEPTFSIKEKVKLLQSKLAICHVRAKLMSIALFLFMDYAGMPSRHGPKDLFVGLGIFSKMMFQTRE